MNPVLLSVVVLALLLSALTLLRWWDGRTNDAEWRRLAALRPTNPRLFEPAMVDELPEPARRFFNFAIAPGAPLLPVAEIHMRGQFSLGNREAPGYRPMSAQEILAAPHGFVWKLRLPGWLPISGADAGSTTRSWTRFRMLGLIPVARMGLDADHLRSAFGRYVAESLFWTPAALLPVPGVTWEAVESNTARVTVSAGALSQTVDVRLGPDGQPTTISFMRWSKANRDKQYRLQLSAQHCRTFDRSKATAFPFSSRQGTCLGPRTPSSSTRRP